MADNQNVVSIIIKAVDNTKKALTSSINNFQDFGKAVGGLVPAAIAVGTAVVTALAVAVDKSIETAVAFEDMSKKTGASVASLSTLTYAANQYNISQESLGTGIKKLSTAMNSAKEGTGNFSDTFQALGIKVTTSTGALRPTQDVLLDLANKFKQLPDGAQKSALAVQLFGKAGTDLIPLLDQGGAGIEALQQQARNLGLEISDNTAAQAEEFTQNLKQLQGAVEGMVRQIMAELLPTLVQLTQDFIKSYNEGGTVKKVLDGIVVTVKGAVTFFSFLGDTVTYIFNHIANEIAGVASILTAFFEGGFKQAKEAFKAYAEQEVTDAQTYYNKLKALAYDTSDKMAKVPYKAGPDQSDANTAVNTWASIQKKAKDYLGKEKSDAKTWATEMNTLNTQASAGVLDLATNTFKAFDDSVTKSMTGLVDGSLTAAKALDDVKKALVDAVVSFIAQKASAFITEQALGAAGDALLGQATAANILAATAITNAYTPAAAAVSLATFGANSGPAIAALTTTFGVAKGLTTSSVPGFATGTDYLASTGVVVAHQGERIVPTKTNQDLTKWLKNNQDSGGGMATINFNLDGTTLGTKITKLLKNGQIDLSVAGV